MMTKTQSKNLPSDKDDQLQDETDTFAEKIKADGIALELNGRKGPEPTRFGDWEKKGKCVDF